MFCSKEKTAEPGQFLLSVLLLNISFPTSYWSEELKEIKHEVLNVRNGLDMRPHRYGVKTSGLKASHQASKTCVKVHVDRQSLSHGYTLPGVQLLIPTAWCVSIPGPSPHPVHPLVPSSGNTLPGRAVVSIGMSTKGERMAEAVQISSDSHINSLIWHINSLIWVCPLTCSLSDARLHTYPYGYGLGVSQEHNMVRPHLIHPPSTCPNHIDKEREIHTRTHRQRVRRSERTKS